LQRNIGRVVPAFEWSVGHDGPRENGDTHTMAWR
jgi:hypothetical protein